MRKLNTRTADCHRCRWRTASTTTTKITLYSGIFSVFFVATPGNSSHLSRSGGPQWGDGCCCPFTLTSWRSVQLCSAPHPTPPPWKSVKRGKGWKPRKKLGSSSYFKNQKNAPLFFSFLFSLAFACFLYAPPTGLCCCRSLLLRLLLLKGGEETRGGGRGGLPCSGLIHTFLFFLFPRIFSSFFAFLWLTIFAWK